MNSLQTYLGTRGYTLNKAELNAQQQKQIRDDLTIVPVQGRGFGPVQTTGFPAYRESPNKLYVPLHYGIKHFGYPKDLLIHEGTNIGLTFNGSLRENQLPVVEAYINSLQKFGGRFGGGLLELPCAYGKCLGRDTEILMYDGTIKKVQDIVVGDILMGDDSTQRNVLSLARGREQMYRISSKKGDSYTCNESHILSLKSSSNHSRAIRKGDIVDISVNDFLNLPKCFHGKGGVLLGYKVGVEFEEQDIEFDPYLVGFWLGDGASRHTGITTQESSVIKYLVDLFKTKHTDLYFTYTGDQYDYRINSLKHGKNSFLDFLRNNNMLQNKHIPHSYLCNTRSVRLALLAGIIDSDGYFNKNCIEIAQKNETLLDNIVFLARSLGFSAYKKEVQKTCTNAPGGPKVGTYYLTNICGDGIEQIPTLCPRKKGYVRKQIKDALTYRLQIEKLEVDDYFGFEIDGNRRFVLADFTVTHNTVLALNIIAQLQKKAIIIVHKDFLANQWVERIQQFLPGARVGRIQGPIIDIHDKDIVIAMLQSLSMKEYSSTTFESFGLTVIDEVHHISSEVFSNSLFKLVTKYMLGLSATMNRKDGTTHVFKMFLGDVVFKGTRDAGDRNVEVRGITYRVNDDEFNEVKTDFRGNVAYSTMISKLCEYNRRSEFILQVLQDLLNDTENCKQIMILGQYKNILKYLHDAIQYRNMASVGYYVGGMKEAALKETETKRVVIATYAMAAEALDIKTLTTLIMATPKTDIEQSVGRILREKHAKPIVVDIIDTHDCFQKQWFKRRAFYKRESYKIIACRGDYTNDLSKWTTIFDPNGKKASYKSCYIADDNDDDEEEEEEFEEEEEEEVASASSSSAAPAAKKPKFTGKCLLPMFVKKQAG